MDLEQCLRLLRANSDEEKFVGLYLVTKFIKAEPGPTLRLIWESIGPSFLHRMLKTQGQVGGAEGGFSYRGLALSILAAFAVDDALASDPQFIATVPTLVSLVHPQAHSEPEIVRDALQCLIAVCNTPNGIDKVISSDGLTAVLLGVTEDEPLELLKARLHLSDKLVRFMSAAQCPLPRESATAVLEHLAQLFRRNQRALKFIILERLPAILAQSFETSQLRNSAEERAAAARQHSKWIEDIRVGLFYVLVSKIGRLQKEHALTLCTYMLRYFGEAWALGAVPPLDVGEDKQTSTTAGEQSEGRFVEVMLLQTGVEVRLLLDSYMHPEIMTRDAALEAQQEVRAKAQAGAQQGKGKASGTWEQEGKKGGPSATPLPREAMRYAPDLPLPASSASVSYVTDELSDDDEDEDEAQTTTDSADSSSSSSTSSAPAAPVDPLVELLASPSDDVQARFESLLSIYYETLEHAITFLAAPNDETVDDDDFEASARKKAAAAKKNEKRKASETVQSWALLNYQALVNIKKMLSDVFETILDFVKDVQQEREALKKKKTNEAASKVGGVSAKTNVQAKQESQGASVRLTLEDLENMDLAETAAADAEKMDVVGEKTPISKPDVSDNGQHVQATDLVVVATMRLLGLWISHDAETLKDSLMRVLPFLVNLQADRARVGVDPFSFLLPGLVPLTQEDDARDKFIDADGHVRLLAFMSEETAAQRSNQGKENFGPLVSCLGILLNLVCLEEGLVNHRDPATFVRYLPALADVARLVDITSPPADTHDTEKALVLAHALVAAFFVLKFHDSGSLAHHWSQLGQELRTRGVNKTTSEAWSVPALLAFLADDYFKLFVLCHRDESLWGEISELWFMATEALRSSLKTHPEIMDKVKASQWLPKAMASAPKGGHAQAALRSIVEPL